MVAELGSDRIFGIPIIARIVNKILAVIQFIMTPASRILVFTQNVEPPYVPLPFAELHILPFSLTNPPSGSQFRLNVTFSPKKLLFTFHFFAAGGNPIPNSSTFNAVSLGDHRVT
ncbi:hypothetical protein KOY48_01365 [Candidatus Minimicrobia naudis]|uniref:Uncharacterized protein n=1 Tax=Candidatus Minimicrobia naudis TaxID=2841263 RepID=A0A8F1MCC6_9BACT|nr:hypothetical protein KOY48_01365 [Candidatus Minimicrobia naudis]